MILHELQMTGGSYVEIRAGNLRPDAYRQRAGIISRIGNTDSSLTAIGSERAAPRSAWSAGFFLGRWAHGTEPQDLSPVVPHDE